MCFFVEPDLHLRCTCRPRPSLPRPPHAGITYNRPAIADWLRQHDASPVTRQPLANKMLTPNVALRNAIMSELGFTSSG